LKAVKAKNLSFTYECPENKNSLALESINLELERGKKIVFLGANGSGKTTLLYHFNGLHLPQKGELEVLGINVRSKTCRELREKVGMVFENPDNQLISTSVYDDVAFGLRNYHWNEEDIKKRVSYILRKVQAEELGENSPYNLSWGQKKRVALAGVLVMEPELLVLDEPFSGLDPEVTGHLLALLDRVNREGKTVVVAAHDVDLAYQWADEVVILSQGKIISQGPPEILSRENHMNEASLDIPLLAKVFKTSPYLPRTPGQARSIIEKLLEGDEN